MMTLTPNTNKQSKPETKPAAILPPAQPWSPAQTSEPITVGAKPKGKQKPKPAPKQEAPTNEPDSTIMPEPEAPKAAAPAEPPTAAEQKVIDNVVQLDAAAFSLKLLRVVTRSPDWSMKIKNAKVVTSRNGKEEAVKGRITPPGFAYGNCHKLFVDLNQNGQKIATLVETYSVVDAEDNLRLISVMKEGEFLCKLAALVVEREVITQQINEKWEEEIIPAIKKAYEGDFEQMRHRLPKPPFARRTEIVAVLRKSDLTNPTEIDWSQVNDPAAQQAAIKMTEGFIKRFAEERAACIIDGVLQPVLDMAMEINGEKPNPNFDSTKPEGPKNPKNLPPSLESGRRRSGALDEMLGVLERVSNFQQFVPAEIAAKIKNATEAIKKCGGDVTNLNSDREIQKAIRAQFSALTPLVRDAMKAGPGRSNREME